MSGKCLVCGTPFTKRRPNSCQKCYFKNRHKERYLNKKRKCISCDEYFYIGRNVYCENCKNNVLKCDENHRIYFGRKFYKDKNGYWICCRSSTPWAHRWVWIKTFGEIPDGLDVHHKDGNKDNNDPNNLELLSRSDHQKKHWEQGDHDHEMEARKQVLAKHRKKRC